MSKDESLERYFKLALLVQYRGNVGCHDQIHTHSMNGVGDSWGEGMWRIYRLKLPNNKQTNKQTKPSSTKTSITIACYICIFVVLSNLVKCEIETYGHENAYFL